MPLLHSQGLLYTSESANVLQSSTNEHDLASFFMQEGEAPVHIIGASLPIRPTTTLYPDNKPLPFGLLFSSTGQVLSSSYPKRYPLHSQAEHILLDRGSLVTQALHGKSSTVARDLAMGHVICMAEPVWDIHHQVIGAIYIQAPSASFFNINAWLYLLLLSGLLLLIFTIPIGGIFGFLTTRRLVSRIRGLVLVSEQFAQGDDPPQLPIAIRDELGQLEVQFNQMVAQLKESTSRQQQLVAQNARLEERARISRDLHDAISQDLFSLRMLARGLRTAIESRTDLPMYIETLEEAVTHMQREMRALLLELRPGKLDELGFVAALQDMARSYSERVGITVETIIQPVVLTIQVEHMLFRIAQEALSNAVRHAGASTITLNLESTDKEIIFSITDDGKGFVLAEEQQSGGSGLQLMRERVQELKGTFALETRTGQGTCIRITLPLLIKDAHGGPAYDPSTHR